MMVGLSHALETRGRLAEAKDTVEGAVEAGRLSGNRQVLSWALVGEGWVAAITGDLERAGRAAEEAVALLAELSDSILTLATHALASLVFLETGDVERCLAEGRRAGAPAFAAIEPGRAAWLLGVLARAELERGDREAARAAIARGRELLAGMSLPLMESTVVQAEALLALAEDEPARAAELAEGGAALADGDRRRRARRAPARAGGPGARGRRRPRRRARPAQARRGRARRRAARTGCAPRRRGSCASSACASRAASAAARAGEGLAALSGREREIAELVAEGRTNREIAAELFVSEKTVEGHLRNVFIKLEVTARAAVAEAVGRARADDVE